MAGRALRQEALVGLELGHYLLVERIGAGGMGEVFRARDQHLERNVAIKVLPPKTFTDESARKHFRKEALALSKLNHPNIATIHDFDTQQGIDFLVMEYVPGMTLSEKLAGGPLPEKEVLRIGTQLAEGLEAAHAEHVIHNDLKPGNLRLTTDGRLKILDFGLAHLAPPINAELETATEAMGLAGTLPYMAPEQLQGEAADARSDLWAAGVVLYEIATGQPPFRERTVTATILRSGDRVRITAQLIRAASDAHVWAETYDRDLRDVLDLQSEVSRTIARQIQVSLSPEEREQLAGSRPVDPEAHELYLKGRYSWNKRTRDSFEKSLQYFQQALIRDPGYAAAYAGMADCYNLMATYDVAKPKDSYPYAKAAALRALQLDNSLAEAHASLAYVLHHYDWDGAAAVKEFQRALELNPGYAIGHQWFSETLILLGRSDEALREVLQARELDPVSLITQNNVGRVLYYAHRFDQAIAELNNTAERDPNYAWPYIFLAMAYEQKNDYSDAVWAAERANTLSHGDSAVVLAHAYAAAGRRDEARKIVRQLEAQASEDYFLAGVYLRLGEKDAAFALLEKAFRQHSHFMPFLEVDPWFDSVHPDPRFRELVRRVGMRGRK